MWRGKNKLYIPVTVKVTLWYTIFLLALLVLLLAGGTAVGKSRLEEEARADLKEAVDDIISGKEEYAVSDDGINFLLYDREGHLLQGKAPAGYRGDTVLRPGRLTEYERDDREFYVYDASYGDYFLRGVLSLSSYTAPLRYLLIGVAVFSPILLFFILFVGYRIMKKAFRPVREISKTAGEIGRSRDFSRRIDIEGGKDEIHRMAETFNDMLDSMERAYNREKEFSADVSHELRTPVSVIAAESEYGLDYADTIEEKDESLEVIRRQSKRMSRMIEDILSIRRLETEEIKKEPVDLTKLLQELTEDYRILAENKGLTLTAEIEEHITLPGNRDLLARLCDNLFSNALKYAKSEIEIRLTDDILLQFIDDGPGIENTEEVFRRFYREDPSRNKEQKDGFGLGLSFVKEIADLHGADVTLKNDDGLIVTVEF